MFISVYGALFEYYAYIVLILLVFGFALAWVCVQVVTLLVAFVGFVCRVGSFECVLCLVGLIVILLLSSFELSLLLWFYRRCDVDGLDCLA